MGGRDRVAVWAAVPYVSNVHLGGDVRHGLTYLPSVVGSVAVTFDLWLWKLPWVGPNYRASPSVWHVAGHTDAQRRKPDPALGATVDRSVRPW